MELLPFVLACIIIELTPGPNMAYLVILTMTAGKRAGFATVAGIAAGLACVAVAAAVGMAEMVRLYPALYEVIRWAGVLYLLWLALDCWRNGAQSDTQADGAKLTYFRHGFWVNVLNPKAAVFYLTVLPAYLPHSPVLWQPFLLITISVSIATVVHLLLVIFAASIRPWFDSPEQQTNVRKVFALLLAMVALWFAASSRA
ncbi:MAG: LysE family translocator [Alphaproteobacteria bacterium]